MKSVMCAVLDVELDDDYGTRSKGKVVVTCSRCTHKTESLGTSERSVRRCLALMREECPKDERNYYETAGRG